MKAKLLYSSGSLSPAPLPLGAGRTLTLLKGKSARGHRVPGACPIVSINHLGVHLAAHVAWKEGFLTYAATSTAGSKPGAQREPWKKTLPSMPATSTNP